MQGSPTGVITGTEQGTGWVVTHISFHTLKVRLKLYFPVGQDVSADINIKQQIEIVIFQIALVAEILCKLI